MILGMLCGIVAQLYFEVSHSSRWVVSVILLVNIEA